MSGFNRLNLLLFAAIAVLIATAPWSAAAAGVFNPETFTLKNGLKVVVISNHRSPVVKHMLWYRIGAADDPPGKSGIAHLLEHLMFKGTKTMAAGAFSKVIARNGGRENAFTGHDTTGYHQTVAVDRLELMMKHEADRMVNLVITDKEVEAERNVVIEERRARTENRPSALLSEQAQAALYLNHPYRIPVIGWKHEIEGLQKQDILDFYRSHYTPANAILIVAGDITAKQLRPLAEKYYGVIPSRKVQRRQRRQEPPQRADRRVTMKSKRVREPRWARDYLAPSRASGATQHSHPLEVLEEILSGGATSRLYRSLVVENKIAISAGAYYDVDSLDLGTFGLYGQPRKGTSIEKFEAAMDAELAKLFKDGVSADEVRRAKKRLKAAAIFARDSLSRGARAIGNALTTGQTIGDVENWPERIGAVTVAQVNAAARAVLHDKRSVTSLLLPKRKGPKSKGPKSKGKAR
ncbi:MAG: pitrilysin family protein [Alphaproteobacteria bacterium]